MLRGGGGRDEGEKLAELDGVLEGGVGDGWKEGRGEAGEVPEEELGGKDVTGDG